MTHNPNPYTMDEQPTSPNRVLLARAFAHWCVLHHGCDVGEIEAALGDAPGVDARTRRQVRDSARLIGELIAAGRVRSFARPIGGGETTALKPGAWELDEYRARMASSGIDPKHPFNADAPVTHWVFLDLDDFNALTAESCGEPPGAGGHPSTIEAERVQHTTGTDEMTDDVRRAPRLLRLPEVRARTGMSRSTIYNRIRDEQFPAPRSLGGNISAWAEADVDRWIEERSR
jgi:prophage regulatory protein